MEENNSEQNIDHQQSTSQIDQITKVPLDPKPLSKIKNPRKVAAGKKLAEYNKKAKEKQKSVQENDENEEEENNNDSSFLPKTSLTSIIALIGLGLTALDLFLRYKSQSNNSKTDENNNKEPVEPDEQEYENVTKIKVINGPNHIGGME